MSHPSLAHMRVERCVAESGFGHTLPSGSGENTNASSRNSAPSVAARSAQCCR